MARVARRYLVGEFFHVLNRGNRRQVLFEQASDYAAFLAILAEAPLARHARLLAFCVMPNHWHLVLWPQESYALSAYVHWVTSTHVRRWLKHRGLVGTGHVYQGRYKSIPIATGPHLLTVLRYVEANPVRAGLTEEATAWPWSSAGGHTAGRRPELCAWPIPRPSDWDALLNAPIAPATLDDIRASSDRGRPLSEPAPARGRPRRLGKRGLSPLE